MSKDKSGNKDKSAKKEKGGKKAKDAKKGMRISTPRNWRNPSPRPPAPCARR